MLWVSPRQNLARLGPETRANSPDLFIFTIKSYKYYKICRGMLWVSLTSKSSKRPWRPKCPESAPKLWVTYEWRTRLGQRFCWGSSNSCCATTCPNCFIFTCIPKPMLWVLRVTIMNKLTENMGVVFYAQAHFLNVFYCLFLYSLFNE